MILSAYFLNARIYPLLWKRYGLRTTIKFMHAHNFGVQVYFNNAQFSAIVANPYSRRKVRVEYCWCYIRSAVKSSPITPFQVRLNDYLYYC